METGTYRFLKLTIIVESALLNSRVYRAT